MTGAKLLLVDDEKNIRLILTQCLDEAGYEVTAAFDGEHALKKLEEERYDLILLDMKLPGMDGLQVLRKIRAMDPRQLVVMITAHGTIETAVEAMKSGAADYLQKPFTPEEIRAVVRHNLAKKPAFSTEEGSGFDESLSEAGRLLQAHEVDRAVPFLRRAVTLNPDRPEPFNLLGIAAEYRGDLDGARRMFRVALALDPSFTPAVANLDRVSQWRYVPRAEIDLGLPLEEQGPVDSRKG
ncbi:MAG: response regulator [Patescibacteria group bacterium]